MPNDYLQTVLARLNGSPTSENLDFFVEAYARVGQLAAVAQSLSERAEQERRFAEATAYAEAKRNGAKTAADAERASIINTGDARLAEIDAREKAAKLKNLLLAVEQAINAIKFLERQTGVRLPH